MRSFDSIDAFIYQRIVRYLSLSDYLSVSLICSQFYHSVRDVILRKPKFKLKHQINSVHNEIIGLKMRSIDLKSIDKYHEMILKLSQKLNTFASQLTTIKKYHRFFTKPHKYNLVLTIEEHPLEDYFPKWKSIILPINLWFKSPQHIQFYLYENDECSEWSNYHLRSLLNWFHPIDIINVDTVYENCEITARVQHLSFLKMHSTRSLEFHYARCKLFLYYRPTFEMPPNNIRFSAIIEDEQTDFEVNEDFLYELDFSKTGKALILLFPRDEWKNKWKTTWPLFNFIKG